MLTTEMYLKRKEEEEIFPHKYGEVSGTHMQIMQTLRSVPYRRFPEHSTLCATVCKTKLDKCSPYTVDYWCSGLGLKLCWETAMCRVQPCFCWSKKQSCGYVQNQKFKSLVDLAVSCHPDGLPTGLQWNIVIFAKLTFRQWREITWLWILK